MKGAFSKVVFTSLFLGILFGVSAVGTTAQNAINGIVFDENRKPLPNVEVELLDSFERLIGSRRTRGGGFYSFQRLNQGIYFIKVRVAGTNYKEKKLRIDLGDLNSIGGVDVKQIDVFMEIDPRRRNALPATTGVVFAQEIPSQAKEHYNSGLKNIGKKNLEAAENNFVKALEVFPDYFDALDSLGDLYLKKGKFLEAENTYKKAIEVNPKSSTSLFGLAVAQNNLKKKPDAAETLKRANEVDGNSINVNLLLGIIQRDLKQYNEAEKALLKAKNLSDNKQPDVNWQLANLYYYNLKKLRQAARELNYYLKNLSRNERKRNPRKVDSIKKLIKKIRSEADAKS